MNITLAIFLFLGIVIIGGWPFLSSPSIQRAGQSITYHVIRISVRMYTQLTIRARRLFR